jgi:dolichol-phosphate mannosyltransferase
MQKKLSVIIPAYNEEDSLPETLTTLSETLLRENIPHEIVVVNDNSKDRTLEVLQELSSTIKELIYYTNVGPNGFGCAVRYGLERFKGDCVAIMMADLSDDPNDLVSFYNKYLEGYDCVFGTRWKKGGKVEGYPLLKRILNRFFNILVQMLVRHKYNDTTNAFKLYSKETIDGLKPFLSPHFNLTLEMPLKAYIRGYKFAVLPNSWRQRKFGESKLKLKEMGSRYFFILLYCLIEKYFSRGDFKRKPLI